VCRAKDALKAFSSPTDLGYTMSDIFEADNAFGYACIYRTALELTYKKLNSWGISSRI